MKNLIEDISVTETLEREASAKVRGGNAVIRTNDWPEFPEFPSGFPFAGLDIQLRPALAIGPFQQQDPRNM